MANMAASVFGLTPLDYVDGIHVVQYRGGGPVSRLTLRVRLPFGVSGRLAPMWDYLFEGGGAYESTEEYRCMVLVVAR